MSDSFTNHKDLTLVIDQGSHASRIALFSETGELIQLEIANISTQSTKAGMFEQDAEEILLSINTLLGKLEAKQVRRIKNCSLCTQRSTVVAWHKQTGKPLSPAISWRDLRNRTFLETLEYAKKDIQQITGLVLSAHYSASKMHWLINQNKKVKQAINEQQLCIAPLASFLIFHLLKNRPYTLDHCNAQRSQLFDIQTLDWSENLLTLFGVNRDFLPECLPVIHHFGELIDLNIPMTSVCGDQNAALHAYPEMQKDTALINIGTGAFVLSQSQEREKLSRLLRSISSSKAAQASYVTEGTVNGAGAAIDAVATDTTSINSTSIEEIFKQLPRWLSENKHPPLYINTVSGLGSPWWCDGGKPGFISSGEMTLSDRYTAIIESIIFLIFRNIQQLKTPPSTLYISGGLSQLNGLCQKLANLSQSQVFRFSQTETTARGSAWLANQIDGSNTRQWHPLTINQKFIPLDNNEISHRYQQFVGELKKRCHND